MTEYEVLRDKALKNTFSPFFISVLEQCPDMVYHKGVCPTAKNAHYTFYPDQSAICATEEEVLLLRKMRDVCKPFRILEIGAYIGWTTLSLAFGHLGSVTVVDDFRESTCDGKVEACLKANLKAFNIRNVILLKQSSDDFFKTHFVKYDFIFIDGFHRNGQPLKDVKGAVQVLSPNGVIVLHDTWMPDVKQASKYLIDMGFNETAFDTDNRLAMYIQG